MADDGYYAATLLAETRLVARLAQDWARADELRREIEALGWRVRDRRDGDVRGLYTLHWIPLHERRTTVGQQREGIC